ncbi:MAG: imidazolonepropionase [Calditrichaeota bacterium]|nr:MAG: imidazolonepropionase [Calditrichota bacterium]
MLKLLHNLRGIITPLLNKPTSELHVQENVALLIEGERIREIAPEETLGQKYPEAIRMDGEGCWALPGFVDPHTHPVFYKTREEEFEMRVQGKSYEEIAAAGGGIRNSVRAFRRASFDEIAGLTYPRVAKFLEYGTTTIEAKSGYGLSVEDEIKSLRILKKVAELVPITIVPTFLGAHEIPDEYQDKRDKYVELIIKEMIPRVAEEQLAVFCDVFCEKNVFTVEESEKILLAAKDHGLIPKLHADELYHTGGAELAARVGAISADHLVQVSDGGIQAMKQAGVIPVLLPGTTFYLGKSRYAPARKMLDAGLPVALATDFNPGSSMTQNMQLMLTIAAIHLGMTPAETLCAATLNSARAIAREKEVGSLEPGKYADIVLMNVPDYRYIPYQYGINHVHMVIRHGHVVHRAVR